MSKFKITKSPYAEEIPKVYQERVQAFITEVQALATKHQFDAYLFAIRCEGPQGTPPIYSCFVAPNDPEVARRLISEAAKTFFGMIQSQQPNAPGGTA